MMAVVKLYIRGVGIGMLAVVKLYDVEAASIDVEMDISFLEIGCDGLPDGHFRVPLLHRAPRGIPDALAVDVRRNEQQVKTAAFSVHRDHHAADLPTAQHDPINFAAIGRSTSLSVSKIILSFLLKPRFCSIGRCLLTFSI